MSKRVRFSDDNLAPQKLVKYDEEPSSSKTVVNAPGSRFKENHSIDSDDEDERDSNPEEEFDKLTEEDVEGAENEEICEDFSVEGGPIVTPFNLKEEMAEGSFDKDGHYHFKKEKEIRDNWLDNIDWVEVKKIPKSNESSMIVDDDPNKEPFNELKIIESIVQLLHKGETVSKGLRRLGGSDTKKKKQRSWKREKVYDLQAEENTDNVEKNENEEETRKGQFLQLTELADQMAGAGHYDIYTDTFEKLQHKLNSLQMSEKKNHPDITDATDADDALDIFADDIDAKKLNKATEKNTYQQDSNDTSTEDGSTKWEYKWSDKDSEVFGPFTSTQMAQWKEQGYFKNTVLVRRTDRPDSVFYNAARIDFDLYD